MHPRHIVLDLVKYCESRCSVSDCFENLPGLVGQYLYQNHLWVCEEDYYDLAFEVRIELHRRLSWTTT